jgi:hypothetical protein
MFAAIFAIFTAVIGWMNSSDDDATSVAAEAMTGLDEDGNVVEGTEPSGWMSSFWDGTKDVVQAVGTGLADADINLDDAITEFALKKEAGVYASIGIGDDGIVQSATSSVSEVLGNQWLWWVGLGLLAYNLVK